MLNRYVTNTVHIAKQQLTALIIPTAQDNDGVDLRDRPASHEGHQGARLEGGRAGDAFKLIEAAQARWRAVNAPHLVVLVRAGARFEAGKLVERPDDQPADTAA